ncbi:MAG: leucine--tRNA ligase [Candidatus Liptonbacteria bacterium]|nr:leucine--tRNA ligase [Candidatus Liptonbacteria bacterium]
MRKYDPKKIESKWQKVWLKNKAYVAKDSGKKPKEYVLVEFPYPSGEGLHTGHLRPYVAGDVYSRLKRMQGKEVMFPIGWDAFGLPAENYAIKHGVQPSVSTAKNIKNAKRQMLSWGLSFDWSREVNTTDPNYYKWTQWIFLQFYKAGLAYEATGLINWCPKDKTGLANEEVVDGKCDRCGAAVEKKELRQWYLKITAYAEKLLEGLKNLPDWPESVKTQQANWIGKSEGVLIDFPVNDASYKIQVFTTRPDTLFGATYVVLAPEHELVENLKSKIVNHAEVKKYVTEAKAKSEEERVAEGKATSAGSAQAKTGVELKGIKAINPANGEKIPVWISDYVLSGYGTGAIMAVPAHDHRDFEFATKFNLLIKPVIMSKGQTTALDMSGEQKPMPGKKDPRYETIISGISKSLALFPTINEGVLINSGKFDEMDSEKAKQEIIKLVNGKKEVKYRLRDWVFSRQRYWGEPIPLIHCEKCALRDPSGQGVVPVPEKDLPVKLPKVKKYEPTGTGESPLAGIEKWVNVKCPVCKGKARRETNTMPQWAGSSWYFLRYTDPKNKKVFADSKKLKHWLPVDVYLGGMEHTTLHLLYSRFWNLFLADKGLVPVKEPYRTRKAHGIILASDGEKMSKSRGNVANPDEIVNKLGADTLRMYELFLGPHEASVSWNDKGIFGISRFLNRVWKLVLSAERKENGELPLLHKTIKKVGEDIESLRFNTAISALMILLNKLEETGANKKEKEILLQLLAPFAPHITEELRSVLSPKSKSIHLSVWPEYDPKLFAEKTVTLVIQINGKVRANIEVASGISQKEAEATALADEKIKNLLGGQKPKRIVYVPGRLINIVI